MYFCGHVLYSKEFDFPIKSKFKKTYKIKSSEIYIRIYILYFQYILQLTKLVDLKSFSCAKLVPNCVYVIIARAVSMLSYRSNLLGSVNVINK